MRIVNFSRIDTVSFPGRFLATVSVESGEGDFSEVAMTLSSDMESLDGLVIIGAFDDAETIPGLHEFIKSVRPRGMPVILITAGIGYESLDDLVGAGYVSEVAIRVHERLYSEQMKTLDILRDQGIPFTVGVVLDPNNPINLPEMAKTTEGHRAFQLIVPNNGEGFKKKDLDAMVSALKGKARNIQVVKDVRRN